MVSRNLEQVKANIEAACKKLEDPKDVRLVAVSKTKPISLIERQSKLVRIPSREKQVQEMCDKMGSASRQYKMACDWSSAAKQGKIYPWKG